MTSFIFSKMPDLAVGYRQRLRELTLGPGTPWGMWQWPLRGGAVWAMIAFWGTDLRTDQMIGWSAVSLEEDLIPVIGCFVAPTYRKRGLATTLVTSVIHSLRGTGVLADGDEVAAVTSRWPMYEDVIAACGLVCKEWQ